MAVNRPTPTAPGLEGRLSIEISDLLRLDEPCVIFEADGRDSDGIPFYVYTVGGFLDGQPVGGGFGVLVGGDAIIIHADSRRAADAMAADGLLATISAIEDNRRARKAEKTQAGVLADISQIGRRH